MRAGLFQKRNLLKPLHYVSTSRVTSDRIEELSPPFSQLCMLKLSSADEILCPRAFAMQRVEDVRAAEVNKVQLPGDSTVSRIIQSYLLWNGYQDTLKVSSPFTQAHIC